MIGFGDLLKSYLEGLLIIQIPGIFIVIIAVLFNRISKKFDKKRVLLFTQIFLICSIIFYILLKKSENLIAIIDYFLCIISFGLYVYFMLITILRKEKKHTEIKSKIIDNKTCD